jgi:hypothetical protein
MNGERATMESIRLAIRRGAIKEPLRGADVNRALKISWGGISLQSVAMALVPRQPVLSESRGGVTD